MSALTDNLVLKVVSEIHDPVTTTDELIPSGETSAYRSNPLALAEFCLLYTSIQTGEAASSMRSRLVLVLTSMN